VGATPGEARAAAFREAIEYRLGTLLISTRQSEPLCGADVGVTRWPDVHRPLAGGA
jgi:hypothetical protein